MPDAGPALVVGLIASPGAATELADGLVPSLTDQVNTRLPGARWTIVLVSDRLVEVPAELTQLVAAARRRVLAEGWQLAVCLTDLPLATARRPVVAHASATHGVAVLSLPALGPVAVSRRAMEGIARLVAALVGDETGEGAADAGDTGDAGHTGDAGDAGDAGDSATRARQRARVDRRMRALGAPVEADDHGIGFVAGIITGNVRLLLGMLRANRPWRLAVRLSRALVATLAAGVVALVTSDIWRLSDALGSIRLTLVMLGSVGAVVLTLIIGAGLWERAPAGTAAPKQVVLFNVVTAGTVLVGVLALYAALFVLTALGAVLVVPGGLLSGVIGQPAGIGDELELAWLASSLATVGGALGAGLESDEAVREAAYGYAPDAELSRG